MSEQTRREHLAKLGLSAAALTAGYASSAHGFAKNETINVAIIGCGGRAGRRLLPRVMKIPGVKVTAICDVYSKNLEHGAKTIGGNGFTTPYFEKVLERKDVDAVLIGTPDHWHAPITIAACQAGKDVYCEKPMTHKLHEAKQVIDAQNKHKRIVQIGTQQRTMPQFKKAKEIIASGQLGEIHKVHMTWNRNHTPFKRRPRNVNSKDFDWKRWLGNAPVREFDPYICLGNWRWYWDFGGGILTDLMVHWLDSVNMVLDLGMPQTADLPPNVVPLLMREKGDVSLVDS